MKIKLSDKELLSLLDQAKNKTIQDDFYHSVVFDKQDNTFKVINNLFIGQVEILPLYSFNGDEHHQINESFDCNLIMHREVMHSGLKAFARANNVTVKFSYNGMILHYSKN